MLRTEKNGDLIKEIEAGIKKEVSVSCSVTKKICSVCGKNIRTHECNHIPGEKYGNNICHAVLSEPVDAYEWSFVAVPAQRKAGVSKSASINKKSKNGGIQPKGSSPDEIIKNALKSENNVIFSKEQIKMLEKYLSDMSEYAKAGKNHRVEAEKDIVSLAAFTIPEMDTEILSAILKKLDNSEIIMLKKAFECRGNTLKIYEPKLTYSDEKSFEKDKNAQFKI